MGAITFLMDRDPAGGNAFFTEAKGFFAPPTSEVAEAPAGGQTLEDVFKVLRNRAALSPPQIYDPINLVSHATGFSSLMFRLRSAAGSPDIIIEGALAAEIKKINDKAPDAWKQLGPPIITSTTRVVLYGCDVGRGASFITNFGRLFGEELHVYAPLRVAVFRHNGTTFEHRLARTWSVPWPSNISQTNAAGWPAARAKFVADALTKFGPTWVTIRNDPLGDIGLEHELKPIADAATEKQAASWFFNEQVSLTITDTQHPQDEINRMIPLESAVISPGGSDVDDTTVKNVISPSHVTHKVNPTLWVAHIAVLAEIIEKPVDVTSTDQYRHVKITPPQAPSPGPQAPAGVQPVGPPAHSSLWDEAREELIAAGVGENEIDDVAEGLVPANPNSLALADPEFPLPEGTDTELSGEDFA